MTSTHTHTRTYPRPGIGATVHYVSHGTPVLPDGTQAYPQKCRAALVTEVGQWRTIATRDLGTPPRGRALRALTQEFDPSACALFVANPTGVFFNGAGEAGCPHDEDDKAGGTWHWPEPAED